MPNIELSVDMDMASQYSGNTETPYTITLRPPTRAVDTSITILCKYSNGACDIVCCHHRIPAFLPGRSVALTLDGRNLGSSEILARPAVSPPKPAPNSSCHLERDFAAWVRLMENDALFPFIIY